MAQAGKETPVVTVIVATYNSSKTLRWTLQSIQNQDYKNFEVRVIGDACTDDSEQTVLALADPRFHWKNLSQNIGNQGGPNNEGLVDARGDYIAYLGHDDLWFPWHLSSLVDCLEKNKADLVFSYTAQYDPKGIQNPLGLLSAEDKTYEDHFVPPSSWLHRKDLTSGIGFWSSEPRKLSCGVDHDFLHRVFKNKKVLQFCPVLSVIKFPSPFWGSYQRTQNYPQEPYLTPLFTTPRDLQARISTEIAIHLAGQLRRRKPWRSCVAHILNLYGKDRFPLLQLMRWRYQKSRKKNQIKRGLPAITP
jgi:glycosyltransferase involved in cell wall biosynthesis